MKKSIKLTIILIILLVFTIFLFPYSNVNSMSGTGQVRSASNELIGSCSLKIKIKETRSLLFTYNKHFTFSLNEQEYTKFSGKPSVSEADEICSITQMFYDADKGHVNSCMLVYPQDFSYAAISLNNKLYCLNCGDFIPIYLAPDIK